MKALVKTTISLLLVIMCLGLYAAGYTAQNEFKLKSGAGGNQCLGCHETFRDITKRRFVHTPVKTGQCAGCHNPHTSSHGKLLDEDTNKICHKCHAAVIPPRTLSVHKVVLEGSCVKCHDPHAADNKFNLVKNGNDLCFSCHKGMGDALAKLKFRHNPVEKGCISCHDPHASVKADHLLIDDSATLCLQCHKPDQPSFVKQHMNYPMAKAGCTSCHDPHGSNTPGMFYDNVHAPVAKKMCNQCHEVATSPTPFKTKKTGFELCRGCHSAMMNETNNKSKMHWPLLDKVGCANCHEPHASKSPKLLTGDPKSLCGKCHSDTMSFQDRLAGEEKRQNDAAKGKVIKGALTHQPVQQGNCDACHAPHAADSGLLLKNKSVIDLCGTCHDWLKHSSHPIGEKVTDSRNRNIKMDCLSCHRAHGTGYRQLIPFPNQTELCVQCHQQYRR